MILGLGLFIIFGALIPQVVILGLLCLSTSARQTIFSNKLMILISIILPLFVWFGVNNWYEGVKPQGGRMGIENLLLEICLIGVGMALVNVVFLLLEPTRKTFWLASMIIIPIITILLVPGFPE